MKFINYLLLVTLAFACQAGYAAFPDDQRLTNARLIFSELNGPDANFDLIPDLYVEDVQFKDPMTSFSGTEKLRIYFQNGNASLKTFEVDVMEEAVLENSIVITYNVKMVVSLFGIFDSEELVYDAATIFRFNDGETKVAFHEDIYNELPVYEQFPFFGPKLKKLKELAVKQLTRGFED